MAEDQPWAPYLDWLRKQSNRMFDESMYTGPDPFTGNYKRRTQSYYQDYPAANWHTPTPNPLSPGGGAVPYGDPQESDPYTQQQAAAAAAASPYRTDYTTTPWEETYGGGVLSDKFTGGGDQSGTGAGNQDGNIIPNDPGDALSQAPTAADGGPPPGYTGPWGGEWYWDGVPGSAPWGVNPITGDPYSYQYSPYYYTMQQDPNQGGRWRPSVSADRYRYPNVLRENDPVRPDPTWSSSYSQEYYQNLPRYGRVIDPVTGNVLSGGRRNVDWRNKYEYSYRRGGLGRRYERMAREGSAMGVDLPPNAFIPGGGGPGPGGGEEENQQPAEGQAGGLAVWRP